MVGIKQANMNTLRFQHHGWQFPEIIFKSVSLEQTSLLWFQFHWLLLRFLLTTSQWWFRFGLVNGLLPVRVEPMLINPLIHMSPALKELIHRILFYLSQCHAVLSSCLDVLSLNASVTWSWLNEMLLPHGHGSDCMFNVEFEMCNLNEKNLVLTSSQRQHKKECAIVNCCSQFSTNEYGSGILEHFS